MRILSFALIALGAASLGGCGKKKTPTPPALQGSSTGSQGGTGDSHTTSGSPGGAPPPPPQIPVTALEHVATKDGPDGLHVFTSNTVSAIFFDKKDNAIGLVDTSSPGESKCMAYTTFAGYDIGHDTLAMWARTSVYGNCPMLYNSNNQRPVRLYGDACENLEEDHFRQVTDTDRKTEISKVCNGSSKTPSSELHPAIDDAPEEAYAFRTQWGARRDQYLSLDMRKHKLASFVREWSKNPMGKPLGGLFGKGIFDAVLLSDVKVAQIGKTLWLDQAIPQDALSHKYGIKNAVGDGRLFLARNAKSGEYHLNLVYWKQDGSVGIKTNKNYPGYAVVEP